MGKKEVTLTNFLENLEPRYRIDIERYVLKNYVGRVKVLFITYTTERIFIYGYEKGGSNG